MPAIPESRVALPLGSSLSTEVRMRPSVFIGAGVVSLVIALGMTVGAGYATADNNSQERPA